MRNRLIITTIVFQFVALLGMLGYAFAPLHFGKEIKVNVDLYDPRDLLRGNYVKLSYDFSDYQYPEDTYSIKKGEKIYAILKKNSDGVYIFDRHSFEKPQSGIFLEGRLNYHQVECGVEAFFLPIDKAQKMEKDIQKSGAWAIISVMDNGKARVKDIIIKNQTK